MSFASNRLKRHMKNTNPAMDSTRLETLRDLKKALTREFKYLGTHFPKSAENCKPAYTRALRSKNLSYICEVLECVHLNKTELNILKIQQKRQENP